MAFSARWHTAGRRIVYCAPNPATALLEVLVHAEIRIENVPVNLRYLEIEAPDLLAIEEVDVHALGQSWRTDPVATRRAGDEWLQSGRTALLRVPSVIVPATWNLLINPRHPESGQIRIIAAWPGCSRSLQTLYEESEAMRTIQSLVLAALATTVTLAFAVAADPPAKSEPSSGPVGKKTGYAPVNGLKMYYEISGEGKPAVYIHPVVSHCGLIPGLTANRQWISKVPPGTFKTGYYPGVTR